jgi:hypothetical protein
MQTPYGHPDWDLFWEQVHEFARLCGQAKDAILATPPGDYVDLQHYLMLRHTIERLQASQLDFQISTRTREALGRATDPVRLAAFRATQAQYQQVNSDG